MFITAANFYEKKGQTAFSKKELAMTHRSDALRKLD